MKKLPIILFIVVIIGIVGWFSFLLTRVNLQVLNPRGIIAAGQRDLIVGSMGFMLAIAIPVMLFAFFVVWKYREGNNSKHAPEWTGNNLIKVSYVGFFTVLVLIFSVIVYKSAYALDPHKPIESSVKPLTVQVVALDWKWLFIYPEEGIATVNFLQVPVNTPINFRLTADDTPMNSFWIPQLSGQIYAMPAMETKIHMLGDSIGDFQGGAAEINGRGFSGMRFITRVSSREDFDKWLEEVYMSPKYLDKKTYEELVKPSKNIPAAYYSSVEPNLYNTILNKLMMPTPTSGEMKNMEHMNMEGMSH